MSLRCVFVLKNEISNNHFNLIYTLEDLGFQVPICTTLEFDDINVLKKYNPDILLIDRNLADELGGINKINLVDSNQFLKLIYYNAFPFDQVGWSNKNIISDELSLTLFWKRKLLRSIDLAVEFQKKKPKKIDGTHLRYDHSDANELVFALNEKGHINYWNTSLCYKTGFTPQEIMGKPLSKIKVIKNPSEIYSIIDSEKENRINNELIKLLYLHKKDGGIIVMQLFSPVEVISNENSTSMIFVGWDITDTFRIIQLLNFETSYLFNGDRNIADLILLNLLFYFQYQILYISRNNTVFIRDLMMYNNNINFLWFRDHDIGNSNCVSCFEDLISNIEKFCSTKSKPVIVMDRMDYYLNKHTFSEFLKCVFSINDIIHGSSSLFLLYADLSLLNELQFKQLRDEFVIIQANHKSKIVLDADMIEWLTLINLKNNDGEIVTFSYLKKWFGVTYPTVRKKIKILKNYGLLNIQKIGRSKTVTLSNKGEDFISNSNEKLMLNH